MPDKNDDSNFVRMSKPPQFSMSPQEVTLAPCGNYVEVYAGKSQAGTYATPGHWFTCGWCKNIHIIASVTPPIVK
jgi:hypothetical protein